MKPCSSFSATQTPWPLAPTRAASLGAPHRTLARSAAASPACRRGRPHPRRTLQTPRRLHELLVRAAGPRGVIAAPATRPPAATAGGCSATPTAVDTHRHRSGGQISCLPSNSRVCRFAEQAASSANGGCCLPSNRSAARGSRCLSASESKSIGHRRKRLRILAHKSGQRDRPSRRATQRREFGHRAGGPQGAAQVRRHGRLRYNSRLFRAKIA